MRNVYPTPSTTKFSYALQLIVTTFFVSSCTTQIRYIGNSLAPTKNVEVFVEEREIHKPYTVIGKAYTDQTIGLVNPEKLQQKSIAKAKEKGADAILISDFTVVYPAVKATSSIATDSTKTSNKNISVPSGDGKDFIVYFLKYN